MTVQDDEQLLRERGFGMRIGFGARPAIIVIDMLKAFTDPNRMLGANLDSQIAAIQPLLSVAHERAVPVFFSIARYDEADLSDAGIWALKIRGAVTIRVDTDGHEVDPRLAVSK